MRLLQIALAIAGLLYGSVVLVAWAGQSHLVYKPDPRSTDPSTVGLQGIEERWIDTPDGVRVVAWFGRAKASQPTLLYFHGNGGNLALRSERFQRFMAKGWGVYMMAYRGYSGSGGEPSEIANVADATLAYQDLQRAGVAPGDMVLYGESLGTGVATRVALKAPVRGMILDAPFTSIVEIGESHYPLLPVNWLLEQRYETIKVIGDVTVPLLVVHGEADRIVPVEMGRRVFAAAVKATPKRLVTLPGAGHANHMRFGSFEAIVAFMDELHRKVSR
jgi:uncharacterized protein